MSALAIATVKAVVPFPHQPERPARAAGVASPDWIVRSDAAGRVQWSNAGARELLVDASGMIADVIELLASAGRGSAFGCASLGGQRLWFGGAAETGLVERIRRVNRLLAEVHRRKQLQNGALLLTQGTIDARARRALRREIISTLEAERGRIARELHDNTGQVLAGLLLNLELVERHLGAASAEALARLARCRELASLTLDQVRDISHVLHLPDWGDVRFDQAVEWLVVQMELRRKLDVRVGPMQVPPDAPPEVKTTLYRALQEALTNVLRHAEARQVVIQTSAWPEGVELVVTDDGRGFDPVSQAAGGHGIGLANVRKRVAMVGGTVEISTAPGRGVRLAVFVPSRAQRRNE